MRDVEPGCWCAEHQKKFENQEEVQMLDLKKRYFVAAGCHSFDVIASWASMHTMKVKDKEVNLPTCGRVYELDVQYNDDLKISMEAGAVKLLERERAIGNVSYDLVMMETCVVVHTCFVD